MKTRRLSVHTFNANSRALWFALAAVTVISEIIPGPHVKPWLFYGLYSPAKLICFLALGFLTPLAFARMKAINQGIAFATISAAIIEVLQGLTGNGHSFHWYELVVKLFIILFGFALGLDVRFERTWSLGGLQIILLPDDV